MALGSPGPLSFSPADCVNMRKPDPTSATARQVSLPIGSRRYASAELVCLALILALLFLATRIAITW
jgi:hypothetical protein